MNVSWTPLEDAALKQAANNGISAQRLAVRFRRSVNSITGRLSFLGLKPTPPHRLPYNERVSVLK